MSTIPWNAPPTYDSTTTSTGTTLTPYLTLPHLLSLTWLATPILSLIFVAFRLQLSLADAQNALDKTKVNLLASCLAAEKAATSTVSMPRYLALATNKQISDAVNGSIEGARIALVLSLTVMEAVLNFVIDLYRSTFLCFLELVVRGGLSILIAAVQELNQAVQTVSSGLRTTLQQQTDTANNVIQTAVNAVNKVNPFNQITAPKIDVPNLDSLQSVTLPSSFQDSLVKLNSTIPTASDIKQKLEAVLNTPFELLKKEINDTFLGLSFNPDGLPIPDQSGVTFCNQLDTSVVDDLGSDLLRTVKIGVLILIALALLLIGLNCLLTWYSWRSLKKHLENTRQAWMSDPTIVHPQSSATAPQEHPQAWTTDPTTVHLHSSAFAPKGDLNFGHQEDPEIAHPSVPQRDVKFTHQEDPTVVHSQSSASFPQGHLTHQTDPRSIVHPQSSASPPQVTLNDHNLMLLGTDWEHPFITKIMNQLSAKFRLTPKQHIHTRWFLHYIFSAPAVACLLIGFFGVLSIQLQLIAMGPLVDKYRGRAQSAVSDFSEVIAASINSSMYNQSSTYANEVNTRVDTIQTTINGGLFGWVNGTTTTLNNTLNAVYTDVQDAVNLVFGGSILETPAQEFVRCFIGSKVDALENAITFLHDHLAVDLPRVNQTVLVLSPESVDEATRPIAAAAIGGSTDDNQGFLGKVIQSYVNSLKEERVMFLIFIGLWGFVCLMGLAVLLWHSFVQPCLGKRKKNQYIKEQRSGLENLATGNEKGYDVSFNVQPPSKRSSLESFWLNTKASPSEKSSHEESAYGDLQPLRSEKKPRTSKLLSVGRMSFAREPGSKKEKEEEVQQPVQDTKSAADRRWYHKMTGFLTVKGGQESEPVFDEQFRPRPRPNLQILTPREGGERGFSPRRSRFSMTPESTPTWKNLVTPLKKAKQTAPPFPPLPLPNESTANAADVIPPAGDLFMARSTTVPIPLYTGFDTPQQQPKLKRKRKGAASQLPTPTTSPDTILYQTSQAPPKYELPPPPQHPSRPSGRHRRSLSSGQIPDANSRWRQANGLVRNTPPKLLPPIFGSPNDDSNLFSKRDENAALNPFDTPFDDEHKVAH